MLKLSILDLSICYMSPPPLCPSAPSAPATLEIPVSAAVERPSGLGRWSPMQEVQSLIPRPGYIPQVTAKMQWHGVTLPDL